MMLSDEQIDRGLAKLAEWTQLPYGWRGAKRQYNVELASEATARRKNRSILRLVIAFAQSPEEYAKAMDKLSSGDYSEENVTAIMRAATRHVKADGTLDMVGLAEELGIQPAQEEAAAALWGFGVAFEVLMRQLKSAEALMVEAEKEPGEV